MGTGELKIGFSIAGWGRSSSVTMRCWTKPWCIGWPPGATQVAISGGWVFQWLFKQIHWKNMENPLENQGTPLQVWSNPNSQGCLIGMIGVVLLVRADCSRDASMLILFHSVSTHKYNIYTFMIHIYMFIGLLADMIWHGYFVFCCIRCIYMYLCIWGDGCFRPIEIPSLNHTLQWTTRHLVRWSVYWHLIYSRGSRSLPCLIIVLYLIIFPLTPIKSHHSN